MSHFGGQAQFRNGVGLGGGRISQEACPMEEAIYLQRGRLTLIKSTLTNLPIYTLSLFRILRRVKSRLEKIQRDSIRGEGGWNYAR